MLKLEVCLENAEHVETGTKLNLPVVADIKNLLSYHQLTKVLRLLQAIKRRKKTW